MDEANLLMQCGIRYLGFPLRLPVNKEDLSEPAAAAIIRGLQPPSYGVAITYQDSAEDIVEFTDYLGASLVQLHGTSRRRTHEAQASSPASHDHQELVIGSRPYDELVDTVHRLPAHSSMPTSPTHSIRNGRERCNGQAARLACQPATGRTRDETGHPGRGLTPENVREAIRLVAPAGVDVHTGVEDAAGHKDPGEGPALRSRSARRFRAAIARGTRVIMEAP
jgi:phosphoribosylanthranilate isomerase